MELFKLLKYSTTVICICIFTLHLNERFRLIGSGNSMKSSPREFLLVIKWIALLVPSPTPHRRASCLSLWLLVFISPHLVVLGCGGEERGKKIKVVQCIRTNAHGGRRGSS